MTEPKFTKGEWIATEGNTSGQEVICPSAVKSNRRIARIGGPDRDANALLMSAAPDLYEALSCFVEYENAMDGGEDVAAMLMYAEASQKARAALAKARGDSAKTIGGEG